MDSSNTVFGMTNQRVRKVCNTGKGNRLINEIFEDHINHGMVQPLLLVRVRGWNGCASLKQVDMWNIALRFPTAVVSPGLSGGDSPTFRSYMRTWNLSLHANCKLQNLLQTLQAITVGLVVYRFERISIIFNYNRNLPARFSKFGL